MWANFFLLRNALTFNLKASWISACFFSVCLFVVIVPYYYINYVGCTVQFKWAQRCKWLREKKIILSSLNKVLNFLLELHCISLHCLFLTWCHIVLLCWGKNVYVHKMLYECAVIVHWKLQHAYNTESKKNERKNKSSLHFGLNNYVRSLIKHAYFLPQHNL